MKQFIRTTWAQLHGDRPLLFLCGLLILLGILYAIFVSISLSPTELQVATRYTAFGGTQYYRNKWFYLIGFVIFGLMIAILHVGAVIKLKSRGMRPLAIAFGWLGALLLGVLFFITLSVLGIAYLS